MNAVPAPPAIPAPTSTLPPKCRVEIESKSSASAAAGSSVACVATITWPGRFASQSAGTDCSAGSPNGSLTAPVTMNL